MGGFGITEEPVHTCLLLPTRRFRCSSSGRTTTAPSPPTPAPSTSTFPLVSLVNSKSRLFLSRIQRTVVKLYCSKSSSARVRPAVSPPLPPRPPHAFSSAGTVPLRLNHRQGKTYWKKGHLFSFLNKGALLKKKNSTFYCYFYSFPPLNLRPHVILKMQSCIVCIYTVYALGEQQLFIQPLCNQ